MKSLKQITLIGVISIFTMSFSQCNSAYKLQDNSPLEFNEVYYSEWSNAARYAGSGINLYLIAKSNKKNIVLDSVYFRKKQVKLEYAKNEIYVGRFKTKTNQSVAIVMSSDPKEEYGNPVPEKPKVIPFELKDNECIVSYLEGDKVKYFKISNILKKQNKASSGFDIRQ